MPCNWQVVRRGIKGRQRMLTHRCDRKHSLSKSANMFLTLLCNKRVNTCWHTQFTCNLLREIVQIWHLPKDIGVTSRALHFWSGQWQTQGRLHSAKLVLETGQFLLVVHHTTVDPTSWHNCVITRIVVWYGYRSFPFTFKSHLQCRANTARHVDKTFATSKSFRLEPSVMTESYGLATWT